MIAEWITEFNNRDNQLIITEMAKRKELSKEEYINLINVLLYYYVITNKPNTLEAVTIICDKLKQYQEDIKKHQNHLFFRDCLSIFLEKERKDGNLEKTNSFLQQEFVFHSFNGAFLPNIREKGLIVKDKPWNLEEVEQIREIFTKINKKNVFGLYQGREKTPVFFANNLFSSAYYGISSPTFFRKFIENSPQYFNVFVNRDYEAAQQSITNLCISLEEQERKIVFDFFHKYWDIFTSSNLPCVAISTKKKLNIKCSILEKLPSETEVEYILRRLSDTKNEMLHENVKTEDLEIFSYETFTFIPYTNEKTYSLSHMSF